MFPFLRRWKPSAVTLLAMGAGLAGVAALAWTNPAMEEYEAYAGKQLVRLATEELCEKPSLPMLLRLWIRNCDEMVASQQATLADLAGRFSTRRNIGLASLFETRLGGQDLLPGMRLPAADVLTLGIAGRFFIVKTESQPGSGQ